MSSPWIRRLGIGALVVLVALVARSAAGDPRNADEATGAALPIVEPAELTGRAVTFPDRGAFLGWMVRVFG
jgi:hypothetical protein